MQRLAHQVRRRRGRAAGSFAIAALALGSLPPVEARGQEARPEGFRLTPSMGWSRGDHRIDLTLSSRGRIEWWDAHAADTDAFYAVRTRVGVEYGYRDLLTLHGEFQDARIYSLGPNTSGAGALYRRFSGGPSTHSDRLRQAWLGARPLEELELRAGRFDVKLGTEVTYPEPNWKYLKGARLSQRLVGTVGWTHGERTNDGLSAAYDMGDHQLFAFAARPTTGVFDVEDAYHRQDEIDHGGAAWTSKRGTWLPDTEVRLFGLVYRDDRSPRHGGLPNAVKVYTLGFSWLGIHPMGPGNLDVLLWGAYQFGRFDRLDHSAAAGILELGYQLTEVPWKPWLRLGVNVASGDGDADDGDHETFFNLLPTNHLYYGFADQFAFQNLVDWILQLKLKPHARVGINLMLHDFRLQTSDDGAYAGTGAFNRDAFGYAPAIAGPAGTRSAATELDAVVSVNLRKGVDLEAGYAYLWGHALFNGLSDDDVEFGYLQVNLRY